MSAYATAIAGIPGLNAQKTPRIVGSQSEIVEESNYLSSTIYRVALFPVLTSFFHDFSTIKPKLWLPTPGRH